MNQMEKKYDLEDRTGKLGKRIILFCQSLSLTPITKPLIIQLVKSATSIGANYMEANGADSKKDFHAKISICKKEAKETTHWLQMVKTAVSYKESEIKPLLRETQELILIFGAINRNYK